MDGAGAGGLVGRGAAGVRVGVGVREAGAGERVTVGVRVGPGVAAGCRGASGALVTRAGVGDVELTTWMVSVSPGRLLKGDEITTPIV